MRRISILAAATALALVSAPAFAECPSGQVNVNPANSPERCETDTTATTPAPDVVEDAGDAVVDAGDAVIDAGKEVADGVGDAAKDVADGVGDAVDSLTD